MIRRAQEKDIPKMGELLSQVDLVHHKGRPDIFKIGRKYNDEELRLLLSDEEKPILVYVDERDEVLGYCFCIREEVKDNPVLCDVKSLYIDDLCVDVAMRGRGIGKVLYDYAVKYARENGYYNLTLNVWACNPSAMRFYEKCGLAVQKVGMELVL